MFQLEKNNLNLKSFLFHSCFLEKEACESEGRDVNISCSNGQLINVVDAVYGKTDICSSHHFDKECSANVISVVSDRLLNEKMDLNKPMFQVQLAAELFNSSFNQL